MKRGRWFLLLLIGTVTVTLGLLPSTASSSTGPEDYAGNAE